MNGTDFKTLMWAYHDERMARKRKFMDNNKIRSIDYIIKLYSPYRSERVLRKLLSIEARRTSRVIKQGATNELD